jgi:dihydrofolate reductase
MHDDVAVSNRIESGERMAPTRRIVMFNRVTADGYFAAPDGNLDWVVPDEELDRSVAAAIERADVDTGAGTILFGRRTYEMFEAFWPHALDDPVTGPDPHADRGRSPEMRAMAVMLNEATKLVFSRTLDEVTWKNSYLLRELDPREIEALKDRPGRDILVFGSGSIVSQLTQHGLIDEYQLVVSPVLLGSGRPLLNGVSTSTRLDLLEAREFPSGNVMLRYAPVRDVAGG